MFSFQFPKTQNSWHCCALTHSLRVHQMDYVRKLMRIWAQVKSPVVWCGWQWVAEVIFKLLLSLHSFLSQLNNFSAKERNESFQPHALSSSSLLAAATLWKNCILAKSFEVTWRWEHVGQGVLRMPPVCSHSCIPVFVDPKYKVEFRKETFYQCWWRFTRCTVFWMWMHLGAWKVWFLFYNQCPLKSSW